MTFPTVILAESSSTVMSSIPGSTTNGASLMNSTVTLKVSEIVRFPLSSAVTVISVSSRLKLSSALNSRTFSSVMIIFNPETTGSKENDSSSGFISNRSTSAKT